MALSLPEVQNDLLGPLGVKGQVVDRHTTRLDIFLTDRLVLPSDQTYHGGVVCTFEYGVNVAQSLDKKPATLFVKNKV